MKPCLGGHLAHFACCGGHFHTGQAMHTAGGFFAAAGHELYCVDVVMVGLGFRV